MKVGLPNAAAEAYEKCLAFCSNDEERLQILSEQAHAYEDSNSWIDAFGTISKARSIIERLLPHQSSHDDLELINSRAKWRMGHTHEALSDCLVCLHATSAADDHRVRAGVMSLMLLDTTCAHDQMPTTFKMVELLSVSMATDSHPVTEARLVYHTLCGDLKAAFAAADSLLTIARQTSDQARLLRTLCNTSVLYRTAGSFDQAIALLLEAVQLAEAHSLPRWTHRIVAMLAHLALEQGDVDAVRKWHVRLQAQSLPQDDTSFALDISSIAARIALIDKQGTLAARLYPRSLAEISRDPSGQPRTYGLALHVAIRLARGQQLSDQTVDALVSSHIMSRRTLHQAFPAFVTYRALQSIGRHDRANELITQYKRTYRRESLAIGKHLLDSIHIG